MTDPEGSRDGDREERKPVTFTGPNLYISNNSMVYDYGPEIQSLKFRINEEAGYGTAHFAAAKEQKLGEVNPIRLQRKSEGLLLAAKYVDRAYGPDMDVDPNKEYLTRTSKKKFAQMLEYLDEALVAQTVHFSDSSDLGYRLFDEALDKVIGTSTSYFNKMLTHNLVSPNTSPTWGKGFEDQSKVWSERDFEALCLLFRHDAEKFIYGINPHFRDNSELRPPHKEKGKG